MATVRPQCTTTFLATRVWYEPWIKHWVNSLSTVASVLLWTIFLAVFMPTFWTANTAHQYIAILYNNPFLLTF